MVSKRYIEAAVKAAYIQGQRDGYKAATKGSFANTIGDARKLSSFLKGVYKQIKAGRGNIQQLQQALKQANGFTTSFAGLVNSTNILRERDRTAMVENAGRVAWSIRSSIASFNGGDTRSAAADLVYAVQMLDDVTIALQRDLVRIQQDRNFVSRQQLYKR